jgi:hypothetical protein
MTNLPQSVFLVHANVSDASASGETTLFWIIQDVVPLTGGMSLQVSSREGETLQSRWIVHYRKFMTSLWKVLKTKEKSK